MAKKIRLTEKQLIKLVGTLTEAYSVTKQEIHITGEGLTTFPQMGQQTKQSVLVLSLRDNNITTIDPDWFAGFEMLGLIDLCNNPINTFPPEALHHLPNLYLLQIDGTNLSREQLEALEEAAPEAVIQYQR